MQPKNGYKMYYRDGSQIFECVVVKAGRGIVPSDVRVNGRVISMKNDQLFYSRSEIETNERDTRPATERPATDKQIAYLISLGVDVPENLTVASASTLIDAAKNGDLGSFGGSYRDGSN